MTIMDHEVKKLLSCKLSNWSKIQPSTAETETTKEYMKSPLQIEKMCRSRLRFGTLQCLAGNGGKLRSFIDYRTLNCLKRAKIHRLRARVICFTDSATCSSFLNSSLKVAFIKVFPLTIWKNNFKKNKNNSSY